uniref:copper resistance CopC family protein n=1 Tax=Candidatus Planktophila sp. TaxID=2175601 RepID=UPI00404B0220
MRKLTMAALAGLCLILSSPSSFAHGQIVTTYPLMDSVSSPTPSQVWIEFDGELQLIEGEVVNTLKVIDSTGLVVSSEEAVIEGAKISTQVSDQSVGGVFTVQYRIVSEDGHPVEGSYTFEASPGFEATEMVEPVSTTTATKNQTDLSIGAIVMAVFLVVFAIRYFVKMRNEKNERK